MAIANKTEQSIANAVYVNRCAWFISLNIGRLCTSAQSLTIPYIVDDTYRRNIIEYTEYTQPTWIDTRTMCNRLLFSLAYFLLIFFALQTTFNKFNYFNCNCHIFLFILFDFDANWRVRTTSQMLRLDMHVHWNWS